MKNNYLLFLLLSILLSPVLYSQTWTPIYDYNIQEFWDGPKVDVSAADVIAVSFSTIKSNRPLEVSNDGGQTWNTIDSDFQRAHVGFDSQDRMYVVSKKKVTNVSTTYIDSLYYSDDLGVTLQPLLNHAGYGYDEHSFYIDPQDNFYCLSSNIGPNGEQQLDYYNAGQLTGNIFTGSQASSSSLRSLIKLSNGDYVRSSYNGGIRYSTDGGTLWTDSQGDGIMGAATFAIFAEANDGTLFLSGPLLVQCSDGGETWTASSLGLTFVNGIRKAGNGTLYAAGDFAFPSIYESGDNGATWVGLQNQPAAGYYDWDLSDNNIYVALKDSTLYSIPVSSGGVGMKENSVQSSALQVYPNPTQAEIAIFNDQYTGENWTIEIMDLNGQLIYSATCYDQTIHLDRSVLSVLGMYVIKAYTTNKVLIGETRLVKMR